MVHGLCVAESSESTYESAHCSARICAHCIIIIDTRFYRAMHFSAKRGIAIACRLSARL